MAFLSPIVLELLLMPYTQDTDLLFKVKVQSKVNAINSVESAVLDLVGLALGIVCLPLIVLLQMDFEVNMGNPIPVAILGGFKGPNAPTFFTSGILCPEKRRPWTLLAK